MRPVQSCQVLWVKSSDAGWGGARGIVASVRAWLEVFERLLS